MVHLSVSRIVYIFISLNPLYLVNNFENKEYLRLLESHLPRLWPQKKENHQKYVCNKEKIWNISITVTL